MAALPLVFSSSDVVESPAATSCPTEAWRASTSAPSAASCTARAYAAAASWRLSRLSGICDDACPTWLHGFAHCGDSSVARLASARDASQWPRIAKHSARFDRSPAEASPSSASSPSALVYKFAASQWSPRIAAASARRSHGTGRASPGASAPPLAGSAASGLGRICRDAARSMRNAVPFRTGTRPALSAVHSAALSSDEQAMHVTMQANMARGFICPELTCAGWYRFE
mmetsp:Transcript_45060/g.128692  ORF Transcript_45060/g.128692 Transcript_45060/m.128692 type:complete len:229 (-) Transcript_45060:179-865(-)